MKFLENYSNFNETLPIEVTDDVGSAFGVVHYSWKTLNNWFINNKIDRQKLDLNDLEFPVAVLKNINVDEDYRNQGIGNTIMQTFLNECGIQDVKTILLESDVTEHQLDGFNLDKWYEGWDFIKIGSSNNNSIFLYSF
jgi:GNAT superfamily N-acetyltransferase